MMTIDELKATRKDPVEEVPTVSDESTSDEPMSDEEMQDLDMRDALDLLNKCMHLLDYLSDDVLCKTITKKERDSMARLSDLVKEYLDVTEDSYVE